MLIHLDIIQSEKEREYSKIYTTFFLPQYCSIMPVSDLVTLWTSVPFMQDSNLSPTYALKIVLLEFKPVQVTLSNIVLKNGRFGIERTV